MGEPKYFTYVPASKSSSPPPCPSPPAPAPDTYYNYAPGHAGRLNSALPPYSVACGLHSSNPPSAPVLYTQQGGHYAYPVGYVYNCSPVAYPTAPGPILWQGSTRAEVDMQNRATYAATAKPTQLVPYKPDDEEQFWCRELDSSYTLRTCKDVQENCQPGVWQHGTSGYPYFVREEKKKEN